ncbi:MAG: lamin tail domain-containing protein [Ignavibacteriales bacterium]|nr:lamin tail domain-containing protein [Ignavibacteriales bacterium]
MKRRLLIFAVLACFGTTLGLAQSGLQLTEILWDIPASPNGDPNGDGTRQAAGDEFFELYNSSNATIDMSGYVAIEREGQVVFTFPVGATLAAKKFCVVFGNAISASWGGSFPAGTLKFSHYTGTTDQGFGPVTTSTGSSKTNLASNGDRIMIVNPLLADTVAEVAFGYDNNVPPRVVKPLWSKGTYLAGAKSVKGDTIVGAIKQSVHFQNSTGKWGRHKDVAKDTSLYFSPGYFPDGTTAVETTDAILPNSILLNQNYPNPFNPSTVISFSIDSRQFVQLNVYNLVGQKIASLMNRTLGAGQYHVTFDAARLPAGIYFYSLEAGAFKETKRMTLLK